MAEALRLSSPLAHLDLKSFDAPKYPNWHPKSIAGTVGLSSALFGGLFSISWLAHAAANASGTPIPDEIDNPIFYETFINDPTFAWPFMTIGVPIYEELKYRFLFSYGVTAASMAVQGKSFNEARHLRAWPIGILSAVIFALNHEHFTGPFIGGLFLWYLARKKGISHSMIAHGTHNALVSALTVVAGNKWSSLGV